MATGNGAIDQARETMRREAQPRLAPLWAALLFAVAPFAVAPFAVVLAPALSAQQAPTLPVPPPRIAVLDFSNGTPLRPQEVEPLRRALGTTLAGALVRSGRVHVVERNRLSALLAEQDLSTSNRVDDATAARVGKLLGADYLFLGAFIVQPNREMMVSTRLVHVSTGTVTAGPEMVGDTKSATKLIARLADALRTQLKLPSDAAATPAPGVKDSPELSAAIDALARACDERDSTTAATRRAAVEKRAPGHPALAAPCY